MHSVEIETGIKILERKVFRTALGYYSLYQKCRETGIENIFGFSQFMKLVDKGGKMKDVTLLKISSEDSIYAAELCEMLENEGLVSDNCALLTLYANLAKKEKGMPKSIMTTAEFVGDASACPSLSDLFTEKSGMMAVGEGEESSSFYSLMIGGEGEMRAILVSELRYDEPIHGIDAFWIVCTNIADISK